MSRNHQRPAAFRTPVQSAAYSNIRRQPSVESFRSAVPSPYIRNQPNAPSVTSNTDYYRKEPVSRPYSTVYGYQNERQAERPVSYLSYYGSNQYDRPPSTRTEFEEPSINARRVYKTRSALNLKPGFTPATAYQREQREPYREPYINGSNYQPPASSQSQYDGYYPPQRENSSYPSTKPYSQPYASSNNPPHPPSSASQYQQNPPASYTQANYQDLNYRRPALDDYREPSEIAAAANYRNESSRSNQPNPGYQSVNTPQNNGYANMPSSNPPQNYSSPGYRKDVGPPPVTAGYRNEAASSGPPYPTNTSYRGDQPSANTVQTNNNYRGDQPSSNYNGYQPEQSPIYESPQEGRQYDAFRKQKEEKQQLPESLRQNCKKVESMLSHARSGSGKRLCNLDVTKQKQESQDVINLQALSVQDPSFDTLKQIYNLSREMAALVLERTTPLTQEEWDSLVEKIQVQSHLVSSIDTI
jgi:hypothetical protein